MYFGSVEKVLTRAGLLDAYRRRVPRTYSAMRTYPARELLENVAIGGALLRSPEEVHAGMHEIGRDNSVAFAGSLLGRTVLRLLSRDPYRLLEQGVSGKRQASNYGRWRVERTGATSATMHFEQEYCWIDSYVLGAGEGTFESIGEEGRFELEMDGPYHGRHLISW